MGKLEDEVFICIDCETTGLDLEKDKIIEVAVVRFTLHTILEEYEALIDPECPISEKSLSIHHITPSMLSGKPKIQEILPSVMGMMEKGLIIGHGIEFDISMVHKEAKSLKMPSSLLQKPLIDTLRLARHYGDSPNNSLENLARHFNVKTEGMAHRAMNDVKMNISVFKHLVRRFKTLEEVFNILAHPIKMKYMPLGKYKGRSFADIPLQYLEWAKKLEFDKDLIHSIEMEIKKRRRGGGFASASNPFMELG